jgi:hypothetical protein
LIIEVHRERGALELVLQLTDPLPDAFEAALPTGAEVRLEFLVKVRGTRSLWWDRRVWSGRVIATVSFDPITGRYRCQQLLDEVIVASREVDDPAAARTWLIAPPSVRLVLPRVHPSAELYVRGRAVFSSSTRWLVFPSIDGTPWVRAPVAPEP